MAVISYPPSVKLATGMSFFRFRLVPKITLQFLLIDRLAQFDQGMLLVQLAF